MCFGVDIWLVDSIGNENTFNDSTNFHQYENLHQPMKRQSTYDHSSSHLYRTYSTSQLCQAC